MGHPHHGQQGQLLPLMRILGLAAVACLTAGHASAQNAREPARPPARGATSPNSAGSPQGEDRVRARFRTGARASGTNVDQAQAEALTLTLSAVAPRPVQNWIRTAGTIDRTGKVLEAVVTGPDAALIKSGQRVRAFPPSSKSSMYQAFVTRVVPRTRGVAVAASLGSSGRPHTPLYVL